MSDKDLDDLSIPELYARSWSLVKALNEDPTRLTEWDAVLRKIAEKEKLDL